MEAKIFENKIPSERDRVMNAINHSEQYIHQEGMAGYIEPVACESMLNYLNLLKREAVDSDSEGLGKILTTVNKLANGNNFAIINIQHNIDFEVIKLKITDIAEMVASELQKVMLLPVSVSDLELMSDEVDIFELQLSEDAKIDFDSISDHPYEIDHEGNVIQATWRLNINSKAFKSFLESTFTDVTMNNVGNFQLEVNFEQNRDGAFISLWLMAKNLKKIELVDTDPVRKELISRWEPAIGAFYTVLDRDDPEDDLYA